VRSKDDQVAEWRDAAAYAPLLYADRSILAWEWLRRNSRYAEAALRSLEGDPRAREIARPECWGLHVFEHPDVGAPEARPLWRAECHSAVLAVLACGSGAEKEVLDLKALGGLTRLQREPEGRELLLISDGFRAIRIDVMAGTLAQGPARLRYLLEGFASAEKPLLTLRRLMAVRKTGRFSASLHPQEARARRWVLMLRAWDALRSGADQREIAEMLLSRRAGEPRWRSASPSLRSQAQRLVKAARSMAEGRYVQLLR
jgi:hypothetical protein